MMPALPVENPLTRSGTPIAIKVAAGEREGLRGNCYEGSLRRKNRRRNLL